MAAHKTGLATGGGLPLPLVYALRDLRGGMRDLRVFLMSLALGVASIAAVLSLSQSIVDGVQSNARDLVGGDVEVRTSGVPEDAGAIDFLRENSVRFSEVRLIRAMTHATDADGVITASALSETKAVDDIYPLAGEMVLDPPMPLADALATTGGVPGAVAEAALLLRLDAQVGDRILLGNGPVEIRATIVSEPDRNTSVFSIGPRLMVTEETLDASGLVTLGSLIRYRFRMDVAEAAPVGEWVETLKQTYPDATWYVRDIRNAEPALTDFLARFTVYLTLVGLTALLIGGIGIGNAVRNHLESKTGTIATLKCLGASGATIFGIYLGQVLVVALIGVTAGLLLGAATPFVLPLFVSDDLAALANADVYVRPLWIAAAYGGLISLAFALWPLARARDIPAATLFRDLVAPDARWPRAPYVIATAGVVAGLIFLAWVTSRGAPFAMQAIAGMIAALVAFRAVAWLLMALVRHLPRPKSTTWRLALSNLVRPGAPTAGVTVSIGTGLSVLIAVALLDANLTRQINETVPDLAPSFFVIDIQGDQTAQFDETVLGVEGARAVDRTPTVLGRLSHVNGVPILEAEIDPEANWMTRQELFITWWRELQAAPEDIVEGPWWPADYDGPPAISFSAEHAGELGVGVGDTLTFNILGRSITAEIYNLREISIRNQGFNFLTVFAPGVLDNAPLTHAAMIYAEDPAEQEIFAAITGTMPNITVLRTKDVIETINGIATRMANAIRAIAGLTLASGILVLAGAVAAGHQRRVYDSVVLKVLGATRGTVTRAYALEFALLGLACVGIATVVGGAGAWLVSTAIMQGDFYLAPWAVGIAGLGGLAIIMGFGQAGTWRALSQSPMPVLRTAAG